jgi:hypothetical protein
MAFRILDIATKVIEYIYNDYRAVGPFFWKFDW